MVARDLSQLTVAGVNQLWPRNAVSAGMIVTGSVRKSGDDLRVTTQLIDGASGDYLWSESIDRKNANIFAIQEEVAQAVLKRLQAGFARAELWTVRGGRRKI